MILRAFLSLPLRERVGVVLGGLLWAAGFWLVVIAAIVLGGSPS